MYIQCCLALWSCMPLIHLALVYIVYHFRSQTVICHQSQTVTFVHDKKCFEIDLSNGQISSRMLLRIFKPFTDQYAIWSKYLLFSNDQCAIWCRSCLLTFFFFFSSFHFYLFSKPFVSIEIYYCILLLLFIRYFEKKNCNLINKIIIFS